MGGAPLTRVRASVRAGLKILPFVLSKKNMETIKPPNILILSSSKEGDSSFQETKEGLQMSLGIERYTVYPLSDVAIKQPWKENCLLLVVPPSFKVTPSNSSELVSFMESGGKCLSMNPAFTRMFTLSSSSNLTVDDTIEVIPVDNSIPPFYTIPINEEESHISHDSSTPNYNTVTVNIAMTTLADIGSLSPCVQLIKSESKAFTLFSSAVHLFNPLLYANKELDNISKIKQSSEGRLQLVRSIFNTLGLECTSNQIPDLTPVYMATQNNQLTEDLISLLQSDNKSSSIVINGEESSAVFITDDFNLGTPVDPLPPTNDKQITVYLKPSQHQLESLDFNTDIYFSSLKSTSIGRSLLIGPVMTSSQTMFCGNIKLTNMLTNELGIVCTPGQQTKGKGRGSNAWISPKGCMMFTCPLKFSVHSQLSKRASIIQHIVALSVISAIRTKPGFEDIPFNIKWPNDIYYKKSVKLGGILVTSYTLDQINTAIIGCGVNVSNHYPTVSVNDCIAMYNNENKTDLPYLVLEDLLALSLSNLEMYLRLFDQWGLSAIESLYYQYWMHQGEAIKLSGHTGVDNAVVVGIDEYGYLRVWTDNNEYLSLHPDGNTFDIMKGLISIK